MAENKNLDLLKIFKIGKTDSEDTKVCFKKDPSSINIKMDKIANYDRTMNGNMVVDIIAIKKNIEVVWDYLSNEDMQQLQTVLEEENSINTALNDNMSIDTFNDIGKIKLKGDCLKKNSNDKDELKVFVDDMEYTPYFEGNKYYWRNVKITFTEA